jgi:hypothetical protein
MANSNGKIWLKNNIRLLVIVASILFSAGVVYATITFQGEKIDTLKTEGCLPSRENDTNIDVILNSLQAINDDICALKIEQEKHDEKLDEILRRLP